MNDNKILKKFMTPRKLRKYFKKFINKKVLLFHNYFHDGWHLYGKKFKLYKVAIDGKTPKQTGDLCFDTGKFAFQEYDINFNDDLYETTFTGEAYFFKHRNNLAINQNNDIFYLKEI